MSQNSKNAKQVPASPTLEEEVQQVLDELWSEESLPFALHVGRITKGTGTYTIHFHDSRVRTAEVAITPGQTFRELVKTSVLARIDKMSGPLSRSKER